MINENARQKINESIEWLNKSLSILNYDNISKATECILEAIEYLKNSPLIQTSFIEKNLTLGHASSIESFVYPIDTYDTNILSLISNPDILEIKSGLMVPKAVGNTTIDLYLDNYTKKYSIAVSVTAREVPSYNKIYNVINSNWGISTDATNYVNNTLGFTNMLKWAAENNYDKVVLENGIYFLDESSYIEVPSNICIDLNGSTLKLNPSANEGIKMINIGKVNNVRITNGTIYGDRESRNSSESNKEFVHGIVLNSCNGVELDNLEITQVQGYGIAMSRGERKNLVFVSKGNLEEYSINNWRTINKINITSIENSFEFSNPFGYGGIGSLTDSVIFDCIFYNSLDEVIEIKENIKYYVEIKKPNGATKLDLKLRNTTINGEGNVDFGSSVIFITEHSFTNNLYIHDCHIHSNKSLGIAYSAGGTNNLIDNNIFENNGGAYANHDLDLEDGWEFMRNLTISNNTFGSKWGVILCSGTNINIYNNTFNSTLDIDQRCVNTRIIDNTFNGRSVNATCEWYSGAVFFNSNNFIGTSITLNNARPKEVKRIYFENDKATNGCILKNISSSQIIEGLLYDDTCNIIGNFI